MLALADMEIIDIDEAEINSKEDTLFRLIVAAARRKWKKKQAASFKGNSKNYIDDRNASE